MGLKPVSTTHEISRLKLSVHGAVQGVGFRPFIYRLAKELRLNGYVRNSTGGVLIEVEGLTEPLNDFTCRLQRQKPPRSSIQSFEQSWLDAVGYTDFEILSSESPGPITATILPDIATCPDCLRELNDQSNRRYQYPFTNCTNCGPRYSILEKLPYDRPNTSMSVFRMCEYCQAEYDDPENRRFHAQPNACPKCGPHIELWDPQGLVIARETAALEMAANLLTRGQIGAIKGIGGFHLMTPAHMDEAVRRLRELKHREEKPFALMFPSLEMAKLACEMTPQEQALLCGPEAPIVLLKRCGPGPGEKTRQLVSELVAPHNPNLGVMLPYTPLHHLLLQKLGFAVVATSGNATDEPLCTDNQEALQRLSGIADWFLIHNRAIAVPVDDSIVRVMADRPAVLRRARGYAPLPVQLGRATAQRATTKGPVLAVGAHLKNTVAISAGNQVFISQHVGDLETDAAYGTFRQAIERLKRLYNAAPRVIAADMHPDYLSTQTAAHWTSAAARNEPYSKSVPTLVSVQHHIAHVLSCMAENELEGPCLGVAWDGTGLGTDKTAWGGEFFVVSDKTIERGGHFRGFCLPGGDVAAREPRRSAMSLLYELEGPAAFERCDLASTKSFHQHELQALKLMLSRRLNCPVTTSVGRLFDGVSSLLGIRHVSRFEGQAAMELENACEPDGRRDTYSIVLSASTSPGEAALVADWGPMIQGILKDISDGERAGIIATKFHASLARCILEVASRLNLRHVVLSGGCFQNRRLLELVVGLLRENEFRPYWHQRVPPNDGGISLGQVVAALRANV